MLKFIAYTFWAIVSGVIVHCLRINDRHTSKKKQFLGGASIVVLWFLTMIGCNEFPDIMGMIIAVAIFLIIVIVAFAKVFL